MNRINNSKKKDFISALINFLIFSAFICGIILKFKGCFPDTANLFELKSILVIYALILNFAFIAASSVFGLLLLPLLSLCLGALSYEAAGLCIAGYTASLNPEIFFPAASAIFFPVFFLTAANGMETSIILINSLSSQGTAAGIEYNKKYIPIMAGTALWAFVLYVIGELKN